MTFMPRRRKRERFNSRPETHYRSASYLKHVRGFCCCLSDKEGHVCEGRIEAAHIRMGSHTGLAQKPHDYLTVPLCAGGHREQHNVGEVTFWFTYRTDPWRIAERIWKASKHYREWINQGGKDNG
jgi:hypothetical protein